MTTDPTDLEAAFRAAVTMHRDGRVEEAAAVYARILAVTPDHAGCLHYLGLIADGRGDRAEGLRLLARATALQPANPVYQSNHGNMLLAAERLDAAEQAFRRALAANPQAGEVHNRLGVVLARQGRFAAAVAAHRQALACAPGLASAHSNLGLCLLALGQFAEGWAAYEWRWRVPDFPGPRRPYNRPPWIGDEPDGRTILVHAEQGLGDTIQFARYLGLLARRHAQVVLECPAPLVRLMRGQDGPAAVVAAGEALPPFDVTVPMMSLPARFGTTLETVPAQVPYLRVGGAIAERWRAIIGVDGRPRIGIAWAGSSLNPTDRSRSLPVDCLGTLLAPANARFFSLQVGPRASDLHALATPAVVDLAPRLIDFAETAGAIANLDLVIAVDTAVAHLAGAMGKPVWVMLPSPPTWRWMIDRADSPWYPTMRLFRQPRPGAWEPVVARVAEALSRFVA